MAGILRTGDRAAREMSKRFFGTYATTTALATPASTKCADGALAIVTADHSVWEYDADATNTLSSNALVPSDSPSAGRWIRQTSVFDRVRFATAAALPANTRTGNVLLADANGALSGASLDGVTPVVGDLVLVKDESTGANCGVYVIDSLGGASAKWQFTRAPGWDSSAAVTPNRTVAVAEGTANADSVWTLTTNATITLNTTALTFAAISVTAGSIGTADIADDAVTADKLADHASTDGSRAVTRNHIRNDAIDGTKIADDAVDSEHIAAGAVDLEHMSANSVDSDQYVDGSIDLAHMSANSIDSDQYVDGSIDVEHLANGIVTAAKTLDSNRAPVRCTWATAAALPACTEVAGVLTADANGALTGQAAADGLTVGLGDVVLVKGDTTKNGIYSVTAIGDGSNPWSMTRLAPFNTQLSHGQLAVAATGTAGANHWFMLETTGTVTPGSTSQTWGTVPAAGTVSGTMIAADAVDSAHIAAGALDPEHFAALSVETAAINDGAVTAAKLANGAGVAALLTAGLGGSANSDHGGSSPTTVLAANASKDCAVLVCAICTETLAGDTPPVFDVGWDADADGLLDTAVLAGATAGDVFFGAGVVPATNKVITTFTAGSGGTPAGAFAVTVLAIPTT